MTGHYVDLTLRLVAALAAGAGIGLERTYHGRPAGFRTYALVCLGSALLMVYASLGLAGGDPAAASRIAQGVVTGIGFLGAGVIFKERRSVHGLTTAASIWVVAGLGMLIGGGYWYAAVLGLGAVLLTLSVLRWVEDRLPHQVFVHLTVCFTRDSAPGPQALRSLLTDAGFKPGRLTRRLNEQTGLVEYRVMSFSLKPEQAIDGLAERLLALPGVKGFDLEPTDD